MNSNDLNNDQLASYYIERLRQCDQSWDELCTSQRQEIARLQQECNNLRLQQTMQRASVAEEISQFCIRLANCAGTNRLGNSTTSSTTNTNTNNSSSSSSSSSSSLRTGTNITSGGRNVAPSTTPLQSLLASRRHNNHQNQNQNQQRNISNNNNNRLIPLRAIIRFLNRYTDGMVMDQTFTQEKRLRDDSAASPILTPAKVPGGGGGAESQQQQNASATSSATTTITNGRAAGFVYPELQAVQPTSRRHLPEYFDGDEDDFVDDFEEVDLDDENDQNNNNIQQQQNQNQQQQQQQQQQQSTSQASCRSQEYMFQQQQQQQQRFSGGSNGQLCPDD